MNLLMVIILLLFMVNCSKQENVMVHNEIDLINQLQSSHINAPAKEYVHQDFKDVLKIRDYRWSIFSHASSSIHFDDININSTSKLSFYIGVDERAWTKENSAENTDGVEFRITNQNNELLFTKYIDPLNNEEDRGWLYHEIELEPISSGVISSITLETRSGETATSDWAYWAEPKITSEGINEVHKDHDKTNIILISLDTLRKDYLRCYGNDWIDTPNIDHLASNGVLFENAYSTSSTTSPSHVSIFTSMNPYVHGVINNEYHLGNKIPTLTQIVKEKDYKTSASVSVMHLKKEISGLGEYFDHYKEPDYKNANNIWQLINSGYSTVSSGIEFIEDHHNDPFFLWLHLYDPHMPYIPPPEYDRRYYNDDPYSDQFTSMKNVKFMRGFILLSQQWMHGINDLEYYKKQYGAEITYIDDQIGRLLDSLKQMKIEENTLNVLTADHGESLGENGIYFNHWSLHEPEIAVPLIFYYPNSIPKNKRIKKRVSIIDIAPSILEMIDDKDNFIANQMFDGKSLVPLWEDKPFERKHILSNSLSYIQNTCIGDRYKVNWVIRDASYNTEIFFPKDRILVYDLINDPMEEKPIAGFMWKLLSKNENRLNRSMEMHERMQVYRENAKLKVVPSVSELKSLFTLDDKNHFIDESLLDDEQFYLKVQSCLQAMQDELHIDLRERLNNVVDLSGLLDIEMKSMSINDETVKEQLGALGYTASD